MIHLIILCYLLLLVYVIEKNKLNKKLEKFNIGLNDDNYRQNIDFLISLAKGDTINCKLLNITNNCNINGNLTVKKGSEFNGDKHIFQDEKNAGRLSVGSIGGIPGIHSMDKDLSLYASSNEFTNIHMNNNLYINGNFNSSVKH